MSSLDDDWWRETTGLTGDQAESKGASSGKPALPGLTIDWAESKGASSGRPDLPVAVLLLLATCDRVQ